MSAEEALFQRFGNEYPEGTVLFKEGDVGKEMFVIQSGKVTISKKVGEVETILAVLGPGEFFGEMSIISNKPRTATAATLEKAKLLVIDPKMFEGMIRANGEIAVRMIKKLVERLSEADAQIENLMLMDPASRVVHHLLQLCHQEGTGAETETDVEFPVGPACASLGISEPAVRHSLDRLERCGLIHRMGDQITVFGAARLKDFLGYLELKWKYGDI